jgi:phosphoglucosamine mutase
LSKPASARRLFGTDGIRGTANRPPMTAETALRLGLAAGGYFTRGDHRHRVVIGKDTRLSGYMLEPALTAGFIAMGMDVMLLGPLPTPGVAMLTRSLRADIGVMISASHNPYQDNGIKLFGPDGYKLSDEIELAIEARMLGAAEDGLAAPDMLGRAVRMEGGRERYVEALKATLPKGMTLGGLRIVIDCAHGAAYGVAPKVLWELGAEVIEIGTQPNGFNINAECGSTAPEAMQAAVRGRARRADRRRPDPGAARDPLAGQRPPARRRGGRHQHVEPRARASPRGLRPAPATHPGRRSLRGRADAAQRLQPRR